MITMPPFLSAILKEVRVQTPDTKSFFFELQSGVSEMRFKPGQHIMIAFRKGQKSERASRSDASSPLFRPYSMTSLPEQLPVFELCIKRYPEGTASAYMHSLKPGDKLEFMKPRGNLYLRNENRNLVFIATGTGITPLMAMIRQALRNGNEKVWLFSGNRTEQDIIYRKEFGQLAKKHGSFSPFFILSRAENGWQGQKGYVQDHLGKQLQDFAGKDYYICGVPKMVVQTQQLLRQKGVPDDCVYTEGWEGA